MDERLLPPDYEFVRALGAGAFGDVVLARQRSLGRDVAIKRIHRHVLSDADALVRFQREGQVLAALHDPAIVRVFDFRTDAADALLVMEFVRGAPFDEALADGALSASAILTVLDDVARALTVAAQAGVVHRDVKPGNVFVLDDGHAKLGDFGLARAVTDPAVFRTVGDVASGTPAYFPPEVSQGAEPDARSDAYSFAVMAYEALVGRRPIRADSPMAMIAAHWAQLPPRPEQVRPGFPLTAGDALLRGLDKAPENRLLPAELMARLRAVPVEAWPAARSAAEIGLADSDATRTAPTPQRAAPNAPLRPASTPARHWSRRSVLIPIAAVIGAAAAVGVVLAVTGGSDPAPNAPEGPIAVRGVRADVSPTSGQCPKARFDFVATITTNGAAGEVKVGFRLPGQSHRYLDQRVHVAAGQRTAQVGVSVPVTGQRPLTGRATIRVDGPGLLPVHSPVIHYSC